MVAYSIKRLLAIIPILFGITVITFIVVHASHIDPVVAALGQQASIHPAIVDAYRQKWGLDKPLVTQYLIYLGNLLHGDLGTSIYTHRSVTQDLHDYLPATIELATAATAISVTLSIPLGIVSARLRGGPVDLLIRAVSLVGVSMPLFWLALAALNIFYLHLGVAPGPGRLDTQDVPPPSVTGLYTADSLLSGQWFTFLDALQHLALPAVVLASWSGGLLTRMTRTSMLAVLHQDFLRTARSRGAREWQVLWRHAFGNAIIPVVTVIGLAYGDLLSGAVVTESIFDWPGVGHYAYAAAAHADFPAIIGVAVVVAFMYTMINFLVDLIYAAADPRVRAAIT